MESFFGIEEYDARQRIGDTNPAQYTHETNVADRTNLQSIVVYDAQQEQNQASFDHFLHQLVLAFPLFECPSKGKGCRYSSYKDEQGEDQVIGSEAIPGWVFKLLRKPLPNGLTGGLGHSMEDLLCTNDPEHVEPPQGVKGKKSFLNGWCSIHLFNNPYH